MAIKPKFYDFLKFIKFLNYNISYFLKASLKTPTAK